MRDQKCIFISRSRTKGKRKILDDEKIVMYKKQRRQFSPKSNQFYDAEKEIEFQRGKMRPGIEKTKPNI